jgi:hypothetical protein
MTPTARKKMIAAYGRADRQLKAALQAFPKRMWKYKPGPERWSIHEILIHLADSEANSFIRCRRCLAEPGKSVMAYDENQWAQALGYLNQDPALTLELFGLLRKTSYRLIRSLPKSAWSRTIEHPENGTMTLENWLAVYTNHIPDHIRQMRATHQAWMAARKGHPLDSSRSFFTHSG